MKTRLLTRIASASIFGTLLLFLGGCGGSGTTAPVVTNNSFAGTYTGDFLSSATPTVIAPITFTISNSGVLQGSGGPTGKTTAISGNVTNSGTGTISIAGTAGTSTGTFANNGLVFYVTFVNATSNTSSYLTLVKNPTTYTTSGTNLFAGPYAGTDDNTSDNIAGPVAFTIDGSGNVTAVALNNHVGQASYSLLTGTVSGSGAALGTFNLQGTVDGVGIGTGSGKLSLTGSILTGSFVVTNGTNTTNASLNMTYLGIQAR
jgi:hypothetical protein